MQFKIKNFDNLSLQYSSPVIERTSGQILGMRLDEQFGLLDKEIVPDILHDYISRGFHFSKSDRQKSEPSRVIADLLKSVAGYSSCNTYLKP